MYYELGNTFLFKVFQFSMELMAHVFNKAHIEMVLPSIDEILPVGISFYVFQALGYMINVYREEVYAGRNLFTYALFVSFLHNVSIQTWVYTIKKTHIAAGFQDILDKLYIEKRIVIFQ